MRKQKITLADRLSYMLKELHAGASIDRAHIQEKFAVTQRTVFRDLERLGDIWERGANGRYYLKASERGKISLSDVQKFAKRTGTEGLHAQTAEYFLQQIRQDEPSPSTTVQGHAYETQDRYDLTFEQLTQAIAQGRICKCVYAEKSRQLAPYRLHNKNGIWYLQATEADKLKTFSLSRIRHLQVSNRKFVAQATVQQALAQASDIWLSGEKISVRLQITKEMAYYFQRRPLFPEQELDALPQTDGSFQFSSQIGHIDQILPLIQYWIPHIQVLAPPWLQAQLANRLKNYLNATET